ncbi:MAG: CDGSH iron-sulfur domain-containing protein [Gemmatimonadota bacterium]
MSAGNVEITARANGPLLVSGMVVVRSADGEILKETEKCALCRCGHSQGKPFCDGSHKTAGFEAP